MAAVLEELKRLAGAAAIRVSVKPGPDRDVA
jgi:hypothetical protein